MAFAPPAGPPQPAARQTGPFRPSLELSFRGHTQTINCVAFLSDPRPAPSPSSSGKRPPPVPKVVSGGGEGAVVMWSPQPTSRALRFLGHRGPVLACAGSPKTDHLLASCGHDGYVRLWMPDLRRSTSSFPGSLPARTEGGDSAVSVWKGHASGAARALAFAQDGSDLLYTAGDDRSVKCWDLSGATTGGGRFVGSFMADRAQHAGSYMHGHNNWVRCLAVQSPQTASSFHYIASGADDGAALVWDTRTRRPVHAFLEAEGSVRSLSFHPDGYGLVSGDATGNIFVYDLRRSSASVSPDSDTRYGLIQHYARAHGRSAVNALSVAPQGGWLLSAGEDGALRLWDLKEGYLYCTVEGHVGGVRSCAFSADGQFFASGGKDRTVMVWRSGLPKHSAAALGEGGGVTRHADPWDSRITQHHDGPPPNQQQQQQQQREERRASASVPQGRPPLSPLTTPMRPAPAEERSFSRSEERYTHLTPGEVTSPPAISNTFCTGGRTNGSVPRYAGNTEATLQRTPPPAEAAGSFVSEAASNSDRIEKLERAVASLAEYMQDQYEEQTSELERSRREASVQQDTQSNEILELKRMMGQLLRQQEELLRQAEGKK